MANVIINDQHLTAIAEAIRGKNGESTTYMPREMAAAIAAIEAGGGGIALPEGYTMTQGIYVPAQSGMNYIHTIQICNGIKNNKHYYPLALFAIVRQDEGIYASGSNAERYLTSCVVLGTDRSSGTYYTGATAFIYRHTVADAVRGGGGGSSSSATKNNGMPRMGVDPVDNAFVRGYEEGGALRFSSYGTNMLEPAVSYLWTAIFCDCEVTV